MVMASVIIPAHQVDDAFKMCLYNINFQTVEYGIAYEVIVVSDNSDDVKNYVTKRHPHFKVLNTNYEGNGVVIARTMGAESAEGELLIFLDADCLCEKDYVQSYIQSYEHECLFIGGISYYTEDFESLISYDNRPQFSQPIKAWRFENIWGPLNGKSWYSGNAGVDRKSFFEIGGFEDLLIGHGGSDSYFGITHSTTYKRVKYVPNMVKHRGLSSGGTPDDRFNRDLYNQLMLENYPDFL